MFYNFASNKNNNPIYEENNLFRVVVKNLERSFSFNDVFYSVLNKAYVFDSKHSASGVFPTIESSAVRYVSNVLFSQTTVDVCLSPGELFLSSESGRIPSYSFEKLRIEGLSDLFLKYFSFKKDDSFRDVFVSRTIPILEELFYIVSHLSRFTNSFNADCSFFEPAFYIFNSEDSIRKIYGGLEKDSTVDLRVVFKEIIDSSKDNYDVEERLKIGFGHLSFLYKHVVEKTL